MGVMPEIAQAVEEMDWLLPTDIQAESIPLILGGGDVLMAAETGSGKTGVSGSAFPPYGQIQHLLEARGSSKHVLPYSVIHLLESRGSAETCSTIQCYCQIQHLLEVRGSLKHVLPCSVIHLLEARGSSKH
ncbi:unnamed protein product, partial [Oncorhynchus mykiss]